MRKTWLSDAEQRTRQWYVNAPHVGHSIASVIDQITKLHLDVRTIADIGCGTGRLIVELLKMFPEARATGYDADALVLSFARKIANLAGVDSRCTFVEQDVRLLDSPLSSGLSFFLAVRGIYEGSHKELIRAIGGLTPVGGIAVVDGLWPTANGYGQQQVRDFTAELQDLKVDILSHRQQSVHFLDSHSGNDGRKEIAHGVSASWFVCFNHDSGLDN